MTKVFFDTNVLFSAMLSQEGAAFELLQRSKQKLCDAYTSDLCLEELKNIEKKANIPMSVIQFLDYFPLSVVSLQKEKKIFGQYVYDPHDAHVVQGASEAGAQFLITYNIKDFNRDLIFKNLNISVLTQGYFLQWLRSSTL